MGTPWLADDQTWQLNRRPAIAMATVLPELVSYLEGLPEPHTLFDRQYRVVAANASYRQQFGYGESVIGRTC